MPFKILNLIDIPWNSGLADYALTQSKILNDNGFKIFWACSKDSYTYQVALKENYPIFEIPDRKKFLNPFLITKLKNFIEENNIEILNSHTGRTYTISYLTSILTKNIKIIRTKSDAREIKSNLILNKAEGIITGSRYIEEMFIKKGFNKKIKTIYKALENKKYKEIKKEKTFKIGILGRLDPVKGHKYFIDSAIKILNKKIDAQFLIAGEEKNIKWEHLKAMIPEKFKKNINYLGYIKNIDDFLEECHLGIITSISSEAVSRVALEWLNSGRAIISTDVGSLKEFIDKEYLISIRDINNLDKKITEILNFEKLEKIGKENKKKSEISFSQEQFKKETISFFENL